MRLHHRPVSSEFLVQRARIDVYGLITAPPARDRPRSRQGAFSEIASAALRWTRGVRAEPEGRVHAGRQCFLYALRRGHSILSTSHRNPVSR